jgi:two-component system, sensor histidine kinase
MSDAHSVPSLTVLLLEDHHDVAESLRMILTQCGGFEISVAADGQVGIEMAIANPPDAVICDIGLPTKDGFEVAKELSARLSQKPLLIAVSGHRWENTAKRALDAGFNYFLVKPVDPAKIHAILRTHQVAKASKAKSGPRSDAIA